jgi:hypothetical protein
VSYILLDKPCEGQGVPSLAQCVAVTASKQHVGAPVLMRVCPKCSPQNLPSTLPTTSRNPQLQHTFTCWAIRFKAYSSQEGWGLELGRGSCHAPPL